MTSQALAILPAKGEAFLKRLELARGANISEIKAFFDDEAEQPAARRTGYARIGSTAVIKIAGELLADAGWLSYFGFACSTKTRQAAELAAADPDVKHLVLDIDTPGGDVTGTMELAEYLHTYPKPTTAYVRGQCCSAGYWVAAGCQRIVVAEAARVGSIGIVAICERRSADRFTIEVVSSMTPGKRPDVETDEGYAQVLELVDDLAAVFLGHVAQLRGLANAAEVATKYATGKTVGAHKALAWGMVDEISNTFPPLLPTTTQAPQQAAAAAQEKKTMQVDKGKVGATAAGQASEEEEATETEAAEPTPEEKQARREEIQQQMEELQQELDELGEEEPAEEPADEATPPAQAATAASAGKGFTRVQQLTVELAIHQGRIKTADKDVALNTLATNPRLYERKYGVSAKNTGAGVDLGIRGTGVQPKPKASNDPKTADEASDMIQARADKERKSYDEVYRAWCTEKPELAAKLFG